MKENSKAVCNACCKDKNRHYFFQLRMYEYNIELFRILLQRSQIPFPTLKALCRDGRGHSLMSLSRDNT